MSRDELYEAIDEVVEGLNESEQVELWNEYCEANNYYDDEILQNDLDDILCGYSPSEVADKLDDAYRTFHQWAWFDGYGDICSSDYITETSYDKESLIDYMIDDDNSFDNYDIRELLDKYAEEDEEE